MRLVDRSMTTSFRAEEVASASLTSRRALLRMGCVCCFALAAPRALADAITPEVERHLAAAKQAAGTDLEALLGRLRRAPRARSEGRRARHHRHARAGRSGTV